jgi:hypothetical protein
MEKMSKGEKRLYLITFILMCLACLFSGLTVWLFFS